jgi:hypothetical protein
MSKRKVKVKNALKQLLSGDANAVKKLILKRK